MRFISFRLNGRQGTALQRKDGTLVGRFAGDSSHPGSIAELVVRGGDAFAGAARQLANGSELDADRIEYLPPLPAPPKVLCLGLNYTDHAIEGGFKPPDYPTLFARFGSSFIG